MKKLATEKAGFSLSFVVQCFSGEILQKVVDRNMQKEFYKMMSTDKFRLEYYILHNEIENESMTVTTYGIEIVKKQRKNGVVFTETKSVKNVCVSDIQIYKVAGLLAEGLVTPITLKDIIEDLIAEQKINTPKEQLLLDSLLNTAM